MDDAFAKSRKVSSELVGLTYGALVAQLVADYEDADKVNAKLEQMGAAMGARLVDEVVCKAGVRRCLGFRDAMATVANVGFRMYLGAQPRLGQWNDDATKCALTFPTETCLEEFVGLGPEHEGLKFCNVLVGVVRGALEAVNIRVNAAIVKDRLRGDPVTEISVELVEIVRETAGQDYEE